MSGKGSAPRPFSVDDETFTDNWHRTFGPKPEPADEDKEPDQ